MRGTARDQRQKEADCFVCVICSHGLSGGIVCVDDETIPLDEITSYFDAKNCPNLKGKPKVFFIQACMGSKESNYCLEKSDGVAQFHRVDCTCTRFLMSSD